MVVDGGDGGGGGLGRLIRWLSVGWGRGGVGKQ